MENDQINIRFFVPHGKTEITVSEELSRAFEVSRTHGLVVDWIQESSLVNKIKLQQNIPEILVIDPDLEGPCYDSLMQLCQQRFLSLIGPICLMTCLYGNCSLPDTKYPVFSGALRGCVVTSSGVKDIEERQRLRCLVQMMWGSWSNDLHDGVTHLVTATVLSDKYVAATKAGLPVMTLSWLDQVWRESLADPRLISAVDKRFSGYKCPPLLGVRVCVTQLERKDRDLIRQNVESGGGEYSPSLDTDTSVLVCVTNTGDKWTAARQWGLPCVHPLWVFDSIEKGECMDPADYRVDGYSSEDQTVINNSDIRISRNIDHRNDSTLPLSSARLSFSESSSRINRNRNESTLPVHIKSRSSFNDSLKCNTSLNNSLGLNSTQPLQNTSLIDELDLKDAKKSGMFLDGCKIYLCGFTKADESHVARVLKYAGAVRLLQLVESVTHVIIGDKSSPDSLQIHKDLEADDLAPVMVDVGWITASMRVGRPLPEAEYSKDTTDVMEDTSETKLVDDSNVFEEDQEMLVDKMKFEIDLLAQYQ